MGVNVANQDQSEDENSDEDDNLEARDTEDDEEESDQDDVVSMYGSDGVSEGTLPDMSDMSDDETDMFVDLL